MIQLLYGMEKEWAESKLAERPIERERERERERECDPEHC